MFRVSSINKKHRIKVSPNILALKPMAWEFFGVKIMNVHHKLLNATSTDSLCEINNT
jgi:hypothetical protein